MITDTTITLSPHSSDIVLYAKYHPIEGTEGKTRTEALKVLVERWTAVDPIFVDENAIISVLVQIVKQINQEYWFTKSNFFERVVMGCPILDKGKSPFERFVDQVMFIIRSVKVKESDGTEFIHFTRDVKI